MGPMPRKEVVQIRVVLADDHAVVRSALRTLLDAEPDLTVVSEARDADTAHAEVKSEAPEVLLLDLNMPGRSSLDLIAVLRSSHPDTGVVVLTMENQPALAQEALDAGARGYVLKQAAERELVAAVHAAAGGELYVQAEVKSRLGQTGATAADDLTARESEVLGLIAAGHTSGQIAERLDLSVRTVESHRAHIQQKLRLGSRPELVRYALDRGLLSLSD